MRLHESLDHDRLDRVASRRVPIGGDSAALVSRPLRAPVGRARKGMMPPRPRCWRRRAETERVTRLPDETMLADETMSADETISADEVMLAMRSVAGKTMLAEEQGA